MSSKSIRFALGTVSLIVAFFIPSRGGAQTPVPISPGESATKVTPQLSLPLRQIANSPTLNGPAMTGADSQERTEPQLPHFPVNPNHGPDGSNQNNRGPNQPAPGAVNFEGIDSNFTLAPPDTEGRVGPNHYVQWVNVRFQIYDKSGTPLLASPVAGNALWQSIGGDCATHNNGDPIVEYDLTADRWILTQFVVGGAAGFSHQCVAVSQTADPTASYYL